MTRDCESVRPWLDAYLDGELASAERRRIERHLAGCAACRQLFSEMQKADEALGDHEAATPPGSDYFEAFPDRFLRKHGETLDSLETDWALRDREPAGRRAIERAARWIRAFERRIPGRLVPVVRTAFVIVVVAGAAALVHEVGTPPFRPRLDLARMERGLPAKNVAPVARSAKGGEGTTNESKAARPITARAVPDASGGGPSGPAAIQAQGAGGPPAPAGVSTPSTGGPPAPDAAISPRLSVALSKTLNTVAVGPPPDELVQHFRAVVALLERGESAEELETQVKTRDRRALRSVPPGATAPAETIAAPEPAAPDSIWAPPAEPAPLQASILLREENDRALPDSTWIAAWRTEARTSADAALRKMILEGCQSALLDYWRMEYRGGRDLLPDPKSRRAAFIPERSRLRALLQCATR